MPESTQHKLDRVRRPRVQITYDVEIGGATEKKELPLVVGVMADLSGVNAPASTLKERKFIDLDRDNFNSVMGSIAPAFKASVSNRLNKNGGSLAVELTFKTLDDFTPSALVRNVPELCKLLDARQRLNDLLAKLDGNDVLDNVLLDVVSRPEDLKQLKSGSETSQTEASANA